MEDIKISVAKKVIYVALNRTTGLADLVLQPYDEAGIAFGVPIAFSELANGAYEASFTPDVLGAWRVRVSSAVNGDDAIKSFEVVASVLADVKTVVDSVETKSDTIITDVDAVKLELDTVKLETDKIQTIDDNVDAIKSDVTTIKANVTVGGYFS